MFFSDVNYHDNIATLFLNQFKAAKYFSYALFQKYKTYKK